MNGRVKYMWTAEKYIFPNREALRVNIDTRGSIIKFPHAAQQKTGYHIRPRLTTWYS